jgi:hypothetical protein
MLPSNGSENKHVSTAKEDTTIIENAVFYEVHAEMI